MNIMSSFRVFAFLAIAWSLLTPATTRAGIGLNHGISDVWKMLHNAGALDPNGDADGDGLTNGQEAAAGTDPFNPNSVIKITAMSVDASGVHLTFPTELGKRYIIQSNSTLNSATWANVVNAVVDGTGSALTEVVPSGATFYRVLVQDIDSDDDGVTDWEERKLGFDPLSANTDGTASPSDYVTISQGLAATTIGVRIASTDDATENGLHSGTFTIYRTGKLNQLTVTYTVSAASTATPNVDYVALSGTITIPIGRRSATINVTPLADSIKEGAETVTVSLNTSASYSVLGTGSATVRILDAVAADGTGLIGSFWSEAATVLSQTTTPTTMGGAPGKTGVLFAGLNDTTAYWASTSAPTADLTGSIWTDGYWAARWTGEILADYSEIYTFALETNFAGRLWINNTLVVDNWPSITVVKSSTGSSASSSSSQVNGTIALQAGIRYPITVEMYNDAGSARCYLFWKSLSQASQFVPANHLFSATATPHINSPLTASALVTGAAGYQFTYQITASGSPTSFSASNLPPGLTVNAAGLISGQPTQVGIWEVPITASNAAGTDSAVLELTVSATGGVLNREVWTDASAANASLADIPLSSNPITSTVTSFESQNVADNFVERLRGYITPPTTGAYQFWLAGDTTAELWISDDADEFKAMRRISLTTPTAFRGWGAASPLANLSLVGGQQYYVEVRHKAGAGSDHVSVGWLKPGETGTAPSEVVPSYSLSPYVAPAQTPFAGTIYTTNLIAQTGAVTNGFGSATLRLNEAGTQAILNFTYANLSSAKTGMHVHSKSAGGLIIFDIDAAVPDAQGNYTWDIIPMGVLSAEQVADCIRNGDAYLNIHSMNYLNGEITGYFQPQDASQVFIPPPSIDPPADDSDDAKQAARFLQQTTFGPNSSLITTLQSPSVTYDSWITDQMDTTKTPISYHLPVVLAGAGANPTDFYPGSLTYNAWWQQSVTGADQLRQRVAFALSEILVVSESGPLDERARAVSNYYDILLRDAFGNFRTILEDVTLSPAMGIYLDMLANKKPDPSTGRIPNENYAREIMQLFSIGLNRLHPDGSLKLDSNNNVIPTYTQSEIVNLAHVFTGWNYNQSGQYPTNFSPSTDEVNPMKAVPVYHFTGPKTLLNDMYLPGLTKVQGKTLDPYATHQSWQYGDSAYQQLPSQELAAVLDMLFQHPNTGPFVCRQLIQRLVTSSPTRGYIYRVVQKFEDDGSPQHVRGNMAAVIRAILTDYEARSSTVAARETFGKQREPVVRVTTLARAFSPPPAVSGTYTQVGNLITVTASSTGLTSSASANLDFSGGAEGNPLDQTYGLTPVNGSNPPQFTTRVIGSLGGTYSQVDGTNVLTVDFGTTQHGLSSGAVMYLDFVSNTSGGLPADNFYPVTVTTSTAFTVTMPDTVGRTGGSNSVYASRANVTYGAAVLSGTYSQAANTASVTVTLPSTPVFSAGATIIADVTSGSLPDGSYSVTSVTPATDTTSATITFDAATSTSARSGNVAIVYVTGDNSRTGNVTVAFQSFRIDDTDTDLAQTPLKSPTVFNFFLPDYSFPGTLSKARLITPEFQLSSETNVVRQAQYLFNGIRNTSSSNASSSSDYRSTSGLSSFNAGGGALTMDFTPWMVVRPGSSEQWTSNNNVPYLIEEINKLLVAGQLPGGPTSTDSTLVRSMIKDYVLTLPYTSANPTSTQKRDRIRAIVQLIATSPDFAIQK